MARTTPAPRGLVRATTGQHPAAAVIAEERAGEQASQQDGGQDSTPASKPASRRASGSRRVRDAAPPAEVRDLRTVRVRQRSEYIVPFSSRTSPAVRQLVDEHVRRTGEPIAELLDRALRAALAEGVRE